jgi:hypothetical protein
MFWRGARSISVWGTSAVGAAVIVAVSAAILIPLANTVGTPGAMAAVGSALAGPGLLLAIWLQTGSGPEGAPYPTDIAPYALNFLFWWVVIAMALAWWRENRRH